MGTDCGTVVVMSLKVNIIYIYKLRFCKLIFQYFLKEIKKRFERSGLLKNFYINKCFIFVE